MPYLSNMPPTNNRRTSPVVAAAAGGFKLRRFNLRRNKFWYNLRAHHRRRIGDYRRLNSKPPPPDSSGNIATSVVDGDVSGGGIGGSIPAAKSDVEGSGAASESVKDCEDRKQRQVIINSHNWGPAHTRFAAKRKGALRSRTEINVGTRKNDEELPPLNINPKEYDRCSCSSQEEEEDDLSFTAKEASSAIPSDAARLVADLNSAAGHFCRRSPPRGISCFSSAAASSPTEYNIMSNHRLPAGLCRYIDVSRPPPPPPPDSLQLLNLLDGISNSTSSRSSSSSRVLFELFRHSPEDEYGSGSRARPRYGSCRATTDELRPSRRRWGDHRSSPVRIPPFSSSSSKFDCPGDLNIDVETDVGCEFQSECLRRLHKNRVASLQSLRNARHLLRRRKKNSTRADDASAAAAAAFFDGQTGSRLLVHRRRRSDNIIPAKYRPKCFDEIVGQRAVVASLSNSVSSGKIAPLYLFHGPTGTGKTTTAKIFAASINCFSSVAASTYGTSTNVEAVDIRGGAGGGVRIDGGGLRRRRRRKTVKQPCGYCKHCRNVQSGTPSDVREVSTGGGSMNPVVGSLLRWARRPPEMGVYKILIVDDCHLVPADAWDLLLAAFRNPPSFLVCIFVTSAADVLPKIVVSSCQRVAFRRIRDADIRRKLQRVVAAEGLAVDEDALPLLAASAAGSLREAETSLEQLRDSNGGGGGIIRAEAVRSLVGLVPNEKLTELLQLALSSDTASTVRCVREVVESGVTPSMLMSQLANLITRHLSTAGGRRRKKAVMDGNVKKRLRRALRIMLEAEKQVMQQASNKDGVTWLTAALLQFWVPDDCGDVINNLPTSPSGSRSSSSEEEEEEEENDEEEDERQDIHGTSNSSSSGSGGGTSITQSPFAPLDSSSSSSDPDEQQQQQQEKKKQQQIPPEMKNAPPRDSLPNISRNSKKKKKKVEKNKMNHVHHRHDLCLPAPSSSPSSTRVAAAAASAAADAPEASATTTTTTAAGCGDLRFLGRRGDYPSQQGKQPPIHININDYGNNCKLQQKINNVRLQQQQQQRVLDLLSSTSARDDDDDEDAAAAPESGASPHHHPQLVLVNPGDGGCRSRRGGGGGSSALLCEEEEEEEEERPSSAIMRRGHSSSNSTTMDDIWEKVLDGSPSSVLRQTLTNEGGKLISLSVAQDHAIARLEFRSVAEKRRAESRRATLAKSLQRALGCPVQVHISLAGAPSSSSSSSKAEAASTGHEEDPRRTTAAAAAVNSKQKQNHRDLLFWEHLGNSNLDVHHKYTTTSSASARSSRKNHHINIMYNNNSSSCRSMAPSNSNSSSTHASPSRGCIIHVLRRQSKRFCPDFSTTSSSACHDHQPVHSPVVDSSSERVQPSISSTADGSESNFFDYHLSTSTSSMSPAYRPGLLCWRSCNKRTGEALKNSRVDDAVNQTWS